MNLLIRLIKAKCQTVGNLSEEINIPYHSLFKVCRESIQRTKTGKIYPYKARYIRQAVADWLGAPYDLVWGLNAAVYLKLLLKKEIERQADIEKEQKIQALGL